MRVPLADGAATTLHVATYPLARTAVRVVRFPARTQLAPCRAGHGVDEAFAGGFFVLETGEPLGEVRTSGIARATVPFDPPWQERRACVLATAGRVRVARRPDLRRAPAATRYRPA